jgi:hypothetical protein
MQSASKPAATAGKTVRCDRAAGVDTGAPGLRRHYHHYYGAFVYDADGNDIEVVCHLPG